jgi:Zn-dependent M28 family amino/carboxypeptidase
MIKNLIILQILLQHNYSFSQSLSIDTIITKESLQQTISVLSHDSLQGRFTGKMGQYKAAVYISNFFKSNNINQIAGITNYRDTFFYSLYNSQKLKVINVVGIIAAKNKTDTCVLISAHYDHIGKGYTGLGYGKISKKDKIFNGANDNATGVAAMLEISKYYSITQANKYNLIFVAFSAEELGLIGSEYFAKNLDLSLFKAVINLEMLGRPINQNMAMITSLKNDKFVNQLNQSLINQKNNSFRFFEDIYPTQKLVERSDHASFMHKVENTFTISGTSPYDKYYHTVDDEYETIDFDYLTRATKQITNAIKCYIE